MTASMHQLEHDDLYSLEEYARRRAEFRARVLEHKRHRRLHLGTCLTLCFEDSLTVQYQVQEMLRIERIFEAEAIAGELAAYNPLIPDGHNWKATLLIEFPTPPSVPAGCATSSVSSTGSGPRWPVARASWRWPMKTWSAAPPRRPRPCISCVSNCRRR